MKKERMDFLKLLVLSSMCALVVSIFVSTINAQESGSKKIRIIHKYKKFEKFDFEEMEIKGEYGAPGELAITPTFKRKFKNNLPYRKNFNAEIKKSIERVR